MNKWDSKERSGRCFKKVKKGNGKLLLSSLNGISSDVQEIERGRENVVVLLNDVWHSTVVNFGCVSSKIL